MTTIMPSTERRRGRPKKTPLDLSLRLNERQRYWLDYLVEKGFRGNSVEEVALRLLDEKFRELHEQKALPDAFIEVVQNASPFQSSTDQINQK
jgi:hypothetical protein